MLGYEIWPIGEERVGMLHGNIFYITVGHSFIAKF